MVVLSVESESNSIVAQFSVNNCLCTGWTQSASSFYFLSYVNCPVLATQFNFWSTQIECTGTFNVQFEFVFPSW
jgi:hypothetical protein